MVKSADFLNLAPPNPETPQPDSQRNPRYTDGFSFDLVDLTRQVLANYATVSQQKWVQAFRAGDLAAFNQQSAKFLKLIDDLDTLLATRNDFLLGPWLADARRKGITPDEKDLYEVNARDLITLWGDANSPLHEYANRQWSGLLTDFYRPRWEKYFSVLRQSLSAGKEPDLTAFENSIRQWEWAWVHQHKTFSTTPRGAPVSTARHLYQKYRSLCSQAW